MSQFQVLQKAATSTAMCLDPNRGYNTNSVKLMASAGGAYFGFGSAVTTGNGAAIPTGSYIDVPCNPSDIFIIGTSTVYAVFADQAGGGN